MSPSDEEESSSEGVQNTGPPKTGRVVDDEGLDESTIASGILLAYGIKNAKEQLFNGAEGWDLSTDTKAGRSDEDEDVASAEEDEESPLNLDIGKIAVVVGASATMTLLLIKIGSAIILIKIFIFLFIVMVFTILHFALESVKEKLRD